MAKIVAAPDEALKNFNLGTDVLEPGAAEAKATQYADAVEAGTEVDPLTEEEQAALYEEVAKIDAAIEKLTERREAIKALYRRLDYGTQTVHAESGGAVLIGHNPIFNEARFTLAHPYDFSRVDKVVEQNKRGKDEVVEKVVYPNRVLYKITPDRPAIKRVLGEDAAKAFYDEGDKKVTIK